MIRYVPLTILVPEECAEEVREYFARKYTGRIEFHTVHGAVVGVDPHPRLRAKVNEPAPK